MNKPNRLNNNNHIERKNNIKYIYQIKIKGFFFNQNNPNYIIM